MELDKKYNLLKNVGVFVATAGIIFETSRRALTPEARREAGKRDAWTCQGVDGEECYLKTLTGEEISYQNGYFVTLAHFKTTQHLSGKGYHDTNPDNARCLCQVCHSTEEMDRGNKWGAQKLLDMGLHTVTSCKEEGREQLYLTVEDALSLREEARKMVEDKKINEILETDRVALESIRERLSHFAAGD